MCSWVRFAASVTLLVSCRFRHDAWTDLIRERFSTYLGIAPSVHPDALRLQEIPQAEQPTPHAGLDRPERLVQPAGNFRLRMTGGVQGDDRALLLWQLRHGLVHTCPAKSFPDFVRWVIGDPLEVIEILLIIPARAVSLRS